MVNGTEVNGMKVNGMMEVNKNGMVNGRMEVNGMDGSWSMIFHSGYNIWLQSVHDVSSRRYLAALVDPVSEEATAPRSSRRIQLLVAAVAWCWEPLEKPP